MTALEELEVLWLGSGEVPTGGPGEAHLQFIRVLREVDGSLTRAETRGLNTGIAFHNPSIRDFMHRELGRNQQLCRELFESSMFFEQTEQLLRLSPSGDLVRAPVNPIGTLAALCGIVERGLLVRSPCLRRVKMVSGEQVLLRAPTDLGRRLSKVANWAAVLERADLMLMVCARAEEWLEEGRLRECGPDQLADFLGFVITWPWEPAGRPDGLIGALVGHVDNYLGDRPSVDDWVAWGRFLDEFSDEVGVGTEGELKARVRSFTEAETEEIIANADDGAQIKWVADQLHELGSVWGIDVKKLVIELEEAASERTLDDDCDDSRSGLVRPSDTKPMAGIEEMFDSLRHR